LRLDLKNEGEREENIKATCHIVVRQFYVTFPRQCQRIGI